MDNDEIIEFMSAAKVYNQNALDVLLKWQTSSGVYNFDVSLIKVEDIHELYTHLYALKAKIDYKINSLWLQQKFAKDLNEGVQDDR